MVRPRCRCRVPMSCACACGEVDEPKRFAVRAAGQRIPVTALNVGPRQGTAARALLMHGSKDQVDRRDCQGHVCHRGPHKRTAPANHQEEECLRAGCSWCRAVSPLVPCCESVVAVRTWCRWCRDRVVTGVVGADALHACGDRVAHAWPRLHGTGRAARRVAEMR